MKLLLDAHVLIWLVSELPKVSRQALEACEDPDNEVLFSAASAWEMQIKHQIGKLDLRLPLGDLISQQQERRRLRLLPIELRHVLAVGDLPSHHRDPFDRLLVATARAEDALLVTDDSTLAKYPVKILW